MSIEPHAPRSPGSRLVDGIASRALELTFTAWDLAPFAHDCGHDGPPLRWDAVRRFLLRCELDAAFFHLYGLGPADTAHVLDTFPVVRKRDEAAHGSDRTAHTILDLHSRLTAATASGTPYVSPLEPPPSSRSGQRCRKR